MNELIGIVSLIAWLVSALVGAIIGMQKGKAGKGAILGFLFGPVGWVLMIFDASVFATLVLVLTTAAIACLLLVVLDGRNAPPPPAPVDAKGKEETGLSQKSSEPQISEDERIPISFRKWALREGIPSEGLAERFYSALEKMKPMRLFKGRIIQHLQDGNLLVDVWTFKPGEECVPRGTITVSGVPGAENIADQTELDCKVYPVGTYQYVTTANAVSTINEFIWMPENWGANKVQSAPTSHIDTQATSSAQLAYPSGVDTPEERRAYLQAMAEARKKRAQQSVGQSGN